MIFIASLLQGSIGFGLGLVAVPIISLIKPDILPVTVLFLVTILSLGMCFREWQSVNWSFVFWAFVGRIPGTIIGAWAILIMSSEVLGITMAVAVIVGIAFSMIGWSPTNRGSNVSIAGLASGVLATTAGIGGPPLIIVMRQMQPGEVRATLGVVFSAGGFLSLGGLVVVGEVNMESTLYAMYTIPFMVAGLVISRFAIRKIHRDHLFVIAITVSLTGALLVILEIMLRGVI